MRFSAISCSAFNSCAGGAYPTSKGSSAGSIGSSQLSEPTRGQACGRPRHARHSANVNTRAAAAGPRSACSNSFTRRDLLPEIFLALLSLLGSRACGASPRRLRTIFPDFRESRFARQELFASSVFAPSKLCRISTRPRRASRCSSALATAPFCSAWRRLSAFFDDQLRKQCDFLSCQIPLQGWWHVALTKLRPAAVITICLLRSDFGDRRQHRPKNFADRRQIIRRRSTARVPSALASRPEYIQHLLISRIFAFSGARSGESITTPTIDFLRNGTRTRIPGCTASRSCSGHPVSEMSFAAARPAPRCKILSPYLGV